jgi:hypothetical protein
VAEAQRINHAARFSSSQISTLPASFAAGLEAETGAGRRAAARDIGRLQRQEEAE